MRYVRAFIDPTELAEIGNDNTLQPLAISAVIDLKEKSMTVLFADGKFLIADLDVFNKSNTKPDFERLKIIDHGHTIALGAYESAVDAI